jgi:hypothetical protein
MSPVQSKSTGPRTLEGKTKSRLNALRHGLTGRVVVLPHEDLSAYNTFCAELMKDLKPEGPLERQFAQTFCDTQWRLNRARSIEDSMFALGHSEAAGNIDPGHPQIHAAMAAANVFRADSKSFVNLSLYEQRLQRTLKESLRQLQELQANRIAPQKEAEAQAKAQKPKTRTASANSPEPNHDFAYSAAENPSEMPGLRPFEHPIPQPQPVDAETISM